MNVLFLLFFHPICLPDTELQVLFTNIKEAKGQVFIAVYDHPSDYMSADKIRAQRILQVSARGNISCSFPELTPGTYAISCFHDVNGNGMLDTNFLGIPTEPYGASNNVRPRFRAPNWEETRFEWTQKTAPIRIRLQKW